MIRRIAMLAALALLLPGCATQQPASDSSRGGSSAGSTASVPRARTRIVPPGNVPLANPGEKDYAPRADEIPPNIADLPDAVPQAEDKSPYGNPSSYEVYGKRYDILDDARGFRESGYASWYGKKFHGKRTSSGVPYDMYAMTAAHKTLPIPCYVRVTNVSNGKSVVVKVNDRGPFHDGRVIDLSYAAASKLDMIGHGSTLVQLEALTPGDDSSSLALATPPPAPAPTPAPASKPSTAAVASIAIPQNAPAPAASSKPAVPVVTLPTPKASSARYLQAGVFGDAVNAAAFREKLASAGIKPLLMKSESRNNRWVYRVLIGPFAEAGQLDKTRARLSADATPTIPVID